MLLIDKQIIVRWFNDLRHWNEAQSFCKQIGATLYREDSKEKANVLAKFRSSGEWIGIRYAHLMNRKEMTTFHL